MKLLVPALLAIALLVAMTPPTAEAAPPVPCPEGTVRSCVPSWDCIQVYPWSRLCQGDVAGFLEAFCNGPCFA